MHESRLPLVRRRLAFANSPIATRNAGDGAVLQANGVPPARETQDYVRHVRRLVEGCRALQRNTRERWPGASPVATAGKATSS